MSNSSTKFTHRFLARILMEAVTPLAVGSGDKDIFSDAVVAKDVNGLPYIPGTTLAGIIRHGISEETAKTFFGYQATGQSKDGRGSEIIFSEAKIIGKDGSVIDGLQAIEWESDFYGRFQELPIRQHVRINEKGTATEGGKFDEQVVYKGTRFCFEIEMVSDGSNINEFRQVIEQLYLKSFRIGSGSRKGFGEIQIVSCITKILNLQDNTDLNFYLSKSSSLSKTWDGESFTPSTDTTGWSLYKLTITPEDLFLFGSGFGDNEADMTPVKEDFIVWVDGRPQFKYNGVVIPASSIKGALAHRVAFHYNKLQGVFADTLSKIEFEEHVGKNNEAVRTLFGAEGEKVGNEMKNQLRGNVIISDILEELEVTDKILNHVAIDRFTGGAIDGALFTEKPTYGKNQQLFTNILVNNSALMNKNIQSAFETALIDVCCGMLPLGGGVNRGNGCFSGVLECNGEIIYPKDGGN